MTINEHRKLEAIRLALQTTQYNYDADGKILGADPDKIVKIAEKYLKFLEGK